ncbi:phage tail sheath family protein [Flavisolibacter sp. BT320]|nr:phage tail sheath family protein [Flavisolibacter longurius]
MKHSSDPHHPRTITAIETALPCFIGYTERGDRDKSIRYQPIRIASPAEYKATYGGMPSVRVQLRLQKDNTLCAAPIVVPSPFQLPYAVQHYFQNGGGPCYIIAVGSFLQARMDSALQFRQLLRGLQSAASEEMITLLVLPDAALFKGTEAHYTLLKAALKQCAERRDRFAILDVWQPYPMPITDRFSSVAAFRSGIGGEHLGFGAAYFPWLQTTLAPFIRPDDATVLRIRGGSGIAKKMVLRKEGGGDISHSLYHQHRPLYDVVMQAVVASGVVLPPSGAMAGVYASVDRDRGVWKAPANVALAGVAAPTVALTKDDTDMLNIDAAEGKSINAIRTFPGKGVLVWGARTLMGNNNEWRYISVRRFFLMVEESVYKGTEWVVFEPNDAGTWVKVKAQTEDFLVALWQQGALQGTKPEHAFYLAVGLGKTMTQQDIQEGRLILEIGMAVVRPTEFITLRIHHKMKPM